MEKIPKNSKDQWRKLISLCSVITTGEKFVRQGENR
jgi:hypothetical protein